MLLGTGLLLGRESFDRFQVIVTVLGAITMTAGLAVILSGFNDRRRTPALFRLDWYLPFLRRNRIIQGRPNLFARWTQKILP